MIRRIFHGVIGDFPPFHSAANRCRGSHGCNRLSIHDIGESPINVGHGNTDTANFPGCWVVLLVIGPTHEVAVSRVKEECYSTSR